MPANNVDDPPRASPRIRRRTPTETLESIVPASPNQPYDMADVIRHVVDEGYLLQVQEHFARNFIVGFARLAGRPVGIVANQPAHLAGTLDIDAAVKGARFVRFCDAFNIPLVTFEDVPGFLPGTGQEYRRHHPSRREAAVCVCRSDGAEGNGDHAQGVWRRVLRDVEQAHPHRCELRMADGGDRGDGRRRRGERALQTRARRSGRRRRARAARIAEYREKFANPYVAAERGFIDEVIRPQQTRAKVIAALAAFETKRDRNPPKKHGNIPL